MLERVWGFTSVALVGLGAVALTVGYSLGWSPWVGAAILAGMCLIRFVLL